MTMSVPKTFIAGEVLTASDLNAHVVSATPTTLTASVDIDGFDLTDADEIEFRNAAANASAAGRLRRNANDLSWGAGGTAGRIFYAGGTDIPTDDIADDAITNAKLRNSGALSVIGRSANSSGDAADISATAAGAGVLRESGSTIGFGTIATAGLADDAVTDAKIRNSGALSVVGRSANSTGDPADISATAAGGGVLRESGSTIGFGTIAAAAIGSGTIATARLGSGTADATTFLRGDQSYAAAGLVAATQAEMESATSTSVAATPGRTQNHPGVVKAWATGLNTTIDASYNVTSFTDVGVGRWSINVTTAYSAATYAPAASCRAASPLYSSTANHLTTSFDVLTNNDAGTATDPSAFSGMAFGDQ